MRIYTLCINWYCDHGGFAKVTFGHNLFSYVEDNLAADKATDSYNHPKKLSIILLKLEV